MQYETSPLVSVAKSLTKNICDLRLDEWIVTPTNHECVFNQINHVQNCGAYFLETFSNKSTTEIAKAAMDVLTTDKYCDQLKLAKNCVNNLIKDCPQEDKRIITILIDDLTSETKCVGLQSGAKIYSISAFLSVFTAFTFFFLKLLTIFY